MKFRKKPVVIEAMQVTEANKTDVAEWCLKAWVLGQSATEYVTGRPLMAIDTLEGRMYASDGDWIIKGVAGEFYPCKPDIFEQTYESASVPVLKTKKETK